jgi:heat shock protein HslJ
MLLAATAPLACAQTDDMGLEDTGWIAVELESRYKGIPGEIRYFDGTADLNGDGSPEVVVYVVGPMVCGTGGCNTLVFTRGETGYEAVADISLTRPPIRVSPQSTQGWANLLVQVSGGGILHGYEAELRFDGTGYPTNPTVEPTEPAADVDGAQVVIPEFGDFTEGKPVPMREGGQIPEGASTDPGPLGQWEWVSFQGMDDSFLAVDDPARYRLEILGEGVTLLADCNRGTGGVQLDGASLAFTQLAVTRMACPPESMDQRYLGYLEYVRGWVVEGGDLYLSLLADGGIMRFRPAAPDALVPGTDFDANADIPCTMGEDEPPQSCSFGVVREGSGSGMVTITKPDGRTRSIFFENGQAMGYDASEADPGEFRASRGGDSAIVYIGEERYEIPDAVIYGG